MPTTIVSSIDDTLSPSSSSSSISSTTSQFTPFVARLKPTIQHLHLNTDPELFPIKTSIQSLHAQLIENSNASMQKCVHDLGRCIGLLIMAWTDCPSEIRKEMELLYKDMMGGARIGRGEGVVLEVEDVVARVKRGEEVALLELGVLIREGLVGEEESGDVIAVLLSRLGAGKSGERLKILLLLRRLAEQSDENKEMAGMESLSTIVRSLTRDVDESREAVGLLMDISVIQRVRQKIGRIQGCIVMLVTLLNGADARASRDARKLLVALSCNTQNVLLMAEAGYFVPLVQYLKEGSDMNKILMATSISRMELTNQMRSALGEQGCIDPLVKMFTSGKLEAKQSSLNALRNLSRLKENIQHLINAGIIPPLLQLLFSVTSVLLTLREPASSILASLAQSELILVHKDLALQILSLLNQSCPTIQFHLLHALYSIASHSKARRVRTKMKENGAMQLLLPFLVENNAKLRPLALNLLFILSKDFSEELTDLLGETHLNILVDIIYTTTSETEKAASVAVLSNLPVNDKKATGILTRANLLPLLVSILGSNSSMRWLIESIAGVLIRFTVPWDKKLQKMSVSQGIIPCLVKLLSDGSTIAKSRAAISLGQLSQNSLSLSKVKSKSWLCTMKSSESFCELHNKNCAVKNTFCLLKVGALSPLVKILEGKEREADEAVLNALATIMLDEIWENGCEAIDEVSGVEPIIRILDVGSLKARERALWILERIFRCEIYREKHGAIAQVVLIDLAQKGDSSLKPMIAKILAHLQLLQMQSSYF